MPSDQTQQLTAALGTFSLIAGLIGLAFFVLFIIAYWKIFSKAGYSGALSLLLLIPIANIIIILYLAFSKWPVLQELEALRARGSGQYPPQQFGQQQPYPPQQYPQR